MGHRIAELLSAESIATAGTKTIDINIGEPISRITVQVRLTNATSTPVGAISAAITKIEVTDGSDILFSLSGSKARALNFYDTGALPFSLSAFEAATIATAEMNIDFGRYLWDKLLALDPKKFDNLQIKITHNKALGASTPTAGTLAVIAHVFDDEQISPVGFLMAKEVYSYALAASGQESIHLPTDYDYRKILFGSLSAGNSPTSQLANVKLSVDNDKRVIINNMACSDIVKMLAGPLAVERLIGLGSGSAVTFYIAPTYETYISFASMGSALAASTNITQSNGGTVAILSDASEAFQALVYGHAPHGMIALPQGDQNDLDGWLNVSKAGSILLALTAGSSVGSASTAEVVLQQKRIY
jgi:hypothetical protein